MKLIILYGPPAVGKLTVAKLLAQQTGVKLFHNHLSVDLVASILSFADEDFWPEVRSIRNRMFAFSAKKKQDLIFTYVYDYGEFEEHINGYIKAYEKEGGEICLVQLTADKDEIVKRVINESRHNTHKIKKPAELLDYMSKHELFKPMKGRKSLTIDNTNLPPEKVVDQIIAHFHL